MQLAESEWTPDAYRDALRRAWQRSHGLEVDDLLKAKPLPFAEPAPEGQLDPNSEPPADPPPPDSAGTEVEEPSIEQVTEQAPRRSVVPAAYHKLVDRLRQGTQTLRDRAFSKPKPSEAEEPVEADSEEPLTDEATSKISGVSATYHDLVDRIRKAKQRFRDRSSPTAGHPEAARVRPAPIVEKPSNLGTAESRRRRLVESIWRSKWPWVTRPETGSAPVRPRIRGDSPTDDPLAPGVADDTFQLPK